MVDIPEWVIGQNEEASEFTPLHVKLYDNWNQVGLVSLTMYSDECNKVAGIFLRASYRFNQHHPPDKDGSKDCMLRWVIKANEEYVGAFPLPHVLDGTYDVPEPYHLWLEYVPCPHIRGDLEKALSKSDANGISRIYCFFDTTSPGLEVGKCTALLVYEHDIEREKQFITRYQNYDGEGAGPSGEGTSNDVDCYWPTTPKEDSTRLDSIILLKDSIRVSELGLGIYAL